MKKKTHLVLFGSCLLVAGWFGLARGGGVSGQLPDTPLKGPVVVELFTSQGCSSCPPADEYLHQLSSRKNVIALSCHVTYWDRLGWKDTLGHEFCGERQQSYSETMGRGGSVFTPEMVVNGSKSVIGNKGWMIVVALQDFDNRITPISVIKEADNTYSVTLPVHTIAQNHPTQVLAFFFGPDETVPIGRGENSGQTLTYAHPVFSIRPLINDWDGYERHIRIQKPDIPKGTKGVAIIVQRMENTDWTIIAAGTYDSVR